MARSVVAMRRIALVLACAASFSTMAACGSSTSTSTSKAGLAAARSHQASSVPAGFVGVVLTPPVFPAASRSIDLARQFDEMAASGVQTVRVVFNWSSAQPYPSMAAVPAAERSRFVSVGGVPTDFSQTDQIAALASRHGMRVLPVVLYTPSWDAAPSPNGTYAPPARTAPYAAYLQALIARYGPHGTFWRSQPSAVPIRAWQIWNEPNLTIYWPKQPFASSYVALLRAAHGAIKQRDPGAQVVLAGLPNYSWQALASIYRVPGARRLFDAVAVHPYTRTPAGVIEILGKVRHVMDRYGDAAKPMIASEISWPSSGAGSEGFDFATTPRGQARNIATIVPLLARQRRRLGLIGFDYYTWAGTESHGAASFNFAGLLRYTHGRIVAKPALSAFRTAALTLEGCRSAAACAPRSP